MSEARVSQVALTPVPLTRREFLNYAWLASLGFVFVTAFGGATFFFALMTRQASSHCTKCAHIWVVSTIGSA